MKMGDSKRKGKWWRFCPHCRTADYLPDCTRPPENATDDEMEEAGQVWVKCERCGKAWHEIDLWKKL
jgi:acetyl-CoA carboxylase beta subunit